MMNDQKPNLEPCPFCGGEAAMNTVRTSCKETIRLNGQDTFHGVNCVSCGASTNGLLGDISPEAAVERWNKRVPSSANTPAYQSLSADDFVRLRDWMADKNRSKASIAFTAGPAREAAYAFESALDMRRVLE